MHGLREVPVLVLLLATLSSCEATPRSDIEGEDDAVFGAVRLTVPFAWDEAWGNSPDAARFGLRLHVEATRGEFAQSLRAGEVVQLDDVTFTGPGAVAVDFDHGFLGLALYGEKSAGDFDFQGSLGVGESALDVEVSMEDLSDSDRLESFGISFDGSVGYRLVEDLSLFYEVFAFSGGGSDDVDIIAVQIGGKWKASDLLVLSFGLRRWDYSSERDGELLAVLSDLELGLEGPFVTLELTF